MRRTFTYAALPNDERNAAGGFFSTAYAIEQDFISLQELSNTMDITQTLAQLKQDPEFSKNVGMVLIHNGVVRQWSRKDKSTVTSIDVTPNLERIVSQKLHLTFIDFDGPKASA